MKKEFVFKSSELEKEYISKDGIKSHEIEITIKSPKGQFFDHFCNLERIFEKAKQKSGEAMIPIMANLSKQKMDDFKNIFDIKKDKSEKDEMSAKHISKLILASGEESDLSKSANIVCELCINGHGFIETEKFTKAIFETLSISDRQRLVGEYIENFMDTTQ